MDWRREDSTYAVATLVATAFVVYIIAGNFGLVPSPFTPSSPRPESVFTVPVLALATTAPTNPGGAGADSPSTSVPTEAPAAPARPTDTTRPSASFTTEGGLVATITEGARVSGTARDQHSGVNTVVVSFQPDIGDMTHVTADLSCQGRARTDCTWSAEVPSIAGTYRVTAAVTDRAGNRATAGPIEITVVNIGGTVEDLTGGPPTNDGGAGGLVDDLGGLLGGLL